MTGSSFPPPETLREFPEAEFPLSTAVLRAHGPDAQVQLNGLPMTLGQVLKFEAGMCEADNATRHDDAARARWIEDKIENSA